MEIKPDEIASILRERIEGLDVDSADLSEVGTVPRDRRRDRPHPRARQLHVARDARAAARRGRPGAQPRGGQRRRRALRRLGQGLEGDTVKRTGKLLEIPVGEELLGRLVDPLGRPLDGKGDINTTETRPAEYKAPGVVHRQPVDRADADRPQGDRLDDPDRPRPARADHRRPPDRQDGDRDRHDHQQQGLRPGLHLRRDRPADVDRRPGDGDPGGERRDGEHDHRRRPRRRGRADQVHGALRRLRDGRVLPLPGQARALHLRRPHQARGRLPADVAAAAAPAGPRGVPGRRLLPPLAAARAGGEALRRAGRRLADRAADHRDAGRRHLGLHPDERHLDHRRADLPRDATSSTRGSARRSTSASRSRGSAATRRPRR